VELFSLLFGFPTGVYSVLLAVCLVYWLLVIVGMADIDLIDLDVNIDATGVLASITGLVSALGLKGVPFTIIVSFLCFWAWLLTALGTSLLTSWLPAGLPVYLAGAVLLPVAAVASFYLTRVSARPLKHLFVQQGEAISSRALVGKVCAVTSGKVDEQWGEARIVAEGAELVLRVHTAIGETLSKGDSALILDYDQLTDRFLVTSLRNAEATLRAS